MNDQSTQHSAAYHSTDSDFRIKVIGVGGAGSNVLDHLVLEGSVNVDLIACNTDVQALAGSVATQKIQLGRHVTRGLGAGGDPELGFSAAEEAIDEVPCRFGRCTTSDYLHGVGRRYWVWRRSADC